MDFVEEKQTKRKWKWFLLAGGIIVVFFLVFFVLDVLTIRKQILSGEYNLERFGGEISGKGGANLGSGKYDVASSDDPSLGNPNAKVTIVEFGDFECPFCQRAFPIMRSLAAEYKEKVRFIYRDFPLSDVHLIAQLAAQAGFCANEQDRFWPYHDKLFLNQDKLSREFILSAAVQTGLDSGQFLSCLDSEASKQEVDDDFAAGVRAGVQGTPTWFINGERVAGVIPEEVFRKIIDDYLGK